MKTILRPALFLLGFTALTTTGCSKERHQQIAAGPNIAAPVYAAVQPPVPAPASPDVANRLKAFTYEQRVEFTAYVKQLSAQADAAVAEQTTGYISLQSTRARQEAMTALDTAATGFKGAVAAVDNVMIETFDSVKSSLVTAWQNLDGALAKAREEKAAAETAKG